MVKLKFELPHPGTSSGEPQWQNYVINLPTALTIQGRKLHRSCLDYTINGGYVFDDNQNAIFRIGAAPDNWAVRQAIRRVRNHWLQMHKEILTNNPELKPKWHDFKMALVSAQFPSNRGAAEVLTYNLPKDVFGGTLPYEAKGISWSVFTTENGIPHQSVSGNFGSEAQGVVDVDKDEFTCHLLGEHSITNVSGSSNTGYHSVGALESWINSRPDLEPITIDADENYEMRSDPITLLFNDGDADDEILENFNDAEGDNSGKGDRYPAYHLQTPNDKVMEVAAGKCTPDEPFQRFGRFNALLGQVYLRIRASSPGGATSGAGNIDVMFDVNPKGASI